MPVISLGQRLSTLDKLVHTGYQHIWDCCCDHGQLGMALLERNAAPNIHFVDLVPELIEALQIKLKHTLSPSINMASQWHTHCTDASEIPLAKSQGKQLIIIAGVGGDLTRDIVSKLHKAHPKADLDYLLCPIRQHYHLRRSLKSLNFRIKQETLVQDKQLIYEVILMTSDLNADDSMPLISETGSQIWLAQDQAHAKVVQRYQEQVRAHYTRMKSNTKLNAEEVLKAYEQAFQLTKTV